MRFSGFVVQIGDGWLFVVFNACCATNTLLSLSLRLLSLESESESV